MNRDKEVLLDLIRASRLIVEFCETLDYQTFAEDLKTQSSVLYQIVIIGEAVNRLSPAFTQAHPKIPINAIRGMRNRVVHEYKEVDIKILWEVIQINIPQLLQQIQTSLAEMKE
ncbi:MAG: DUF86 domain-containing protein [Coleofasciculus sp. B1-GNL1-01]|uniref:HepT-like ribonuclease domain-containing protein n=1 Tax=Coleofasciculus sp. B1-GNL1-01 TaxID=3068484 RepID=UPI00330534EA